MAKRGMSVPAYAYAANNPISLFDPDGYWVRSVAGGLKSYAVAMQQTPTGRLLWDRMQASPNPIDFVTGQNPKNESGRRPGEMVTKAPACGGAITVTVDLSQGRDDWDILMLVGHGSTHVVQAEESYRNGWTEKDYSGVMEPNAIELGLDVALEYFGGWQVTQ